MVYLIMVYYGFECDMVYCCTWITLDLGSLWFIVVIVDHHKRLQVACGLHADPDTHLQAWGLAQ
jgi:hypothetical protein